MPTTELGATCPCTPIPLVRKIHAAAARASEWPGVLDHLRARFTAEVVTLGHHAFTTGSDSALLESPDDVDFSRGMAIYAARNPWFLVSSDYVPGRVLTGDEIISHRDLKRTDFYRGFLQPRGLLYRLCGVVAQHGCGAQLLCVYRSEKQNPFSADEKAELAVLLDHITLSLQSQWRWQEADDLARALMAQADQDSNALILVTPEAEPIYCNPAAGHLLEQGVGLRLEGSRLVAAHRNDQGLLRETIAHAAESGCNGAVAAPTLLALACVPPAPPMVVSVRAAGWVCMPQAGTQRGLVMLSIRAGYAGHKPETCVFARQYALTLAQARVSSLIFAGQPLTGIAQSLKVSENTVRSHLKQIFQKTETHGQMELVHLHARLCPTLH